MEVNVKGAPSIEVHIEAKVVDSYKTADQELSSTSVNPVQNKVITEELNKKVNKTDIATVNGQPLTEGGNIEVVADSYDDTELKEQVAELEDAVTLQGTKTSLNEAEIGQLKDSKADKEGYYSSLVAGAAENLINTSGDGVVREFTYDTAGGTADIGTGTAIIKRMRGKSLVWNQRLKLTPKTLTSAGVTATISEDGRVTISGQNDGTGSSVLYLASNIEFGAAGHKYAYIAVGVNDGANWGKYGTYFQGVAAEAYQTMVRDGVGHIFTATAERASSLIYAIWPSVAHTDCSFYPMLFDLTQMFGAGNEPATIEEFKSLFPRDDYAYNAGEVIHFNGRRLLTTGFNQWDEQWRNGHYASLTGKYSSSSQSVCNVNPIRVLPNQEYYNARAVNIYIESFAFFYDADMNFISMTNMGNGRFTTPANAVYMNFYFAAGQYGTTYNNDICINLSWSGYRNGEYEPYEEHILELPYGVYGDGLKSAGTAYDEVTEERYVKRIGVVDLGTLDWTKASSGGVFYTTINDLKWVTESKLGFSGNYSKMLCGKYVSVGTQSITSASEIDKSLSSNSIQEKRVQISDTSYTDAASFKAAMAGVMLYYELAEPIVTEFETPLNLGYYVNDFGTEMILPENGIAPFTAPAAFDILYAMNAVDTLRNLPTNYISKESFDNFSAALSSALANAGITMSIKATFDEESGAYNYTITASKTE